MKIFKNTRVTSVAICAFFFAYLLSFVFEGQVLYSRLRYFQMDSKLYIIAGILGHFIGLFLCGFFVKSLQTAKKVLRLGLLICVILTLPFFFPSSLLWVICLFVIGFTSGFAFACWGYYLKVYTPKNQRIKTCADVLIVSNIIMIFINVLAINVSSLLGLSLALLSLIMGLGLSFWTPAEPQLDSQLEVDPVSSSNLRNPLLLLFLFVAVITINSGLMYQVINPAFAHLPTLVSWYWAIPYIIALLIMRNLPQKIKRSNILYVGMAMIMVAFICFMLLGKGTVDYLIIDTLLLGACGIFDLFWWSIIGEMLDYAQNPVKVSGIALSANVFGVLCGDLIGVGIAASLPKAEITVIALCVVCVTLVLLPVLNSQLVLLLKSHAYLSAYSTLSQTQQRTIVQASNSFEPLTERENQVLECILAGKTNKQIAATLFISENTVKTHVHNIYSKYDVNSRAALISIILHKQNNA